VLIRLRKLLFGRDPSRGNTIGSSLASANRVSQFGSLAPPPGPFDTPPDEPVILEEIPWELQEPDEAK
jgi:hypothetical protein